MSSGRSRGRVLIAGGSLGGLMAGAILHREGWEVRIFERVSGEIESRGAGIATHDKLFEAFARAGVRVDSEIGMPLVGRTAFDRHGQEIGHYPYQQVLSPWGILYRRLREAVPAACYELGKEVRRVDSDDRGVALVFADGSRVEGDLVIGADGIWSQVRAQLFPQAKPGYCGYVAWRGLIDESRFEPDFARKYAPIHSFYIERGEQFIFHAVNGSDDSLAVGHRRFGFLWYRAVDEQSELPALLTDIDGVTNAHSIAPPKIQPRHIEHLRQLGEQLLPPDFALALRRTPHPFLQPIFDLKSDTLVKGCVALMGDAAFVARPHVGAGVLKAACDAIALADALKECDSMQAALARYDAQRVPEGKFLVERSRYLGGYLEGSKRVGEPAPVLPIDEVIRESGRG